MSANPTLAQLKEWARQQGLNPTSLRALLSAYRDAYLNLILDAAESLTPAQAGQERTS